MAARRSATVFLICFSGCLWWMWGAVSMGLAVAAPRKAINLTVPQGPAPLPRTLRMRPEVAQAGQGKKPGRNAQTSGTRPAASRGPAALDTEDTDGSAGDMAQRDRARQVIEVIELGRDPYRAPPKLVRNLDFYFDVGVGIDGGESSKQSRLVQNPSPSTALGREYGNLRIYNAGNVMLSGRGILVPGIDAYLASQFYYDRDFSSEAQTAAVPSRYDTPGVQDLRIRTAYAQVEHAFAHPLLRPIFLRAGRQYRYGPAVAYFDGLTASYDGPKISLSGFVGSGVDLEGFAVTQLTEDSGRMGGLDARVDLEALRLLPAAITAGFLLFDGHVHGEGRLTLRWSSDIFISAGLRTLDLGIVRRDIHLRARISPVTTIHVEVDSRDVNDWMYDLFTVAPRGPGLDGTTTGDRRRYLLLGEPLPRVYMSLRAGTVLFDNIDVLLRGALAVEHDDFDRDSAHSPSFAELGSALEVRLRRTLALGASVLVRGYRRPKVEERVETGNADPLPVRSAAAAIGERSFIEGGTMLRYTGGTRKFSASAQGYVRYYDHRTLYDVPLLNEDSDIRGGARFTIEAWVTSNHRIRAEYDVSTTLFLAPELRGLKSLLIAAEGRF